MADSQVNNQRREDNERFAQTNNEPYCEKCGYDLDDCECSDEESQSYRSSMIDAGRGHLLR